MSVFCGSLFYKRCALAPPRLRAHHLRQPRFLCRSSILRDDNASGNPQQEHFSAKYVRDIETSPSKAKSLTRRQRAAMGGAGTLLATAGLGGLAWLHWPILAPSTMCAIGGGCGVALLAVAARGELPKKTAKTAQAKQNLDLKLLNDSIKFKGDAEALAKLSSNRHWPPEVQKILADAEKAEEDALRASKAAKAKDLLENVKSELAAGGSPKAIEHRLRPKVFVFDFKHGEGGPTDARPQTVKNQIELLRTSVSFILATASKHDEALLRLSSPGGTVPAYGLAAAQLQRLRDAGVHLTICVDVVAASGGYMMACVANRIVAAPFAMIGSIGVIAGVPNFHKILERNEVEFTQVTAGKYKRTVNVLTPNTEEGLAKFKDDVDTIHAAFQEHIGNCRPCLDVSSVATGEVWLGIDALKRGLVDQVGTSDQQIFAKVQEGYDAVELTRAEKKKQGLSKLLEGLNTAEALQSLRICLQDLGKDMWMRLRGGSVAPRVEALDLHGINRE